MKVLHVIDSGGRYGAERVLIALMVAHEKIGIKTELASIAEPGLPEKPLEAEARRNGLMVRRHVMRAGPDLRSARRLAAAARSDGFDLLHTHGYKANTLLAGMRHSRRGLPAVATLHGWTASRRLSRMGVYETVERWALKRADRVIAVSRQMVKRWGLEVLYGDRLSIIPNGTLLDVYGRTAEPRLPADLEEFVRDRSAILSVGRLSYEKGFDILLGALAVVRAKGIDACLVLAGEGGERESLLRQVELLGLTDAVRLPGYIADAEAVMRHFQVVTIPSRSEGLPVVLLEALAAGVPVVATAVGEMPAVMDDCSAGHCVPSGDPVGLAERLFTALLAPPAAEALQSSACRVRSRYSAERMAAAYRSAYIAAGVSA